MNYFSNLFIGRKQNVVQATGYLDTGNTLKDISTGKHVVIASPEIMYAASCACIRLYKWDPAI